MPTYEHDTEIGVWTFKALVESSKLRQMTINEEAGHRNKANARVQHETRWSGTSSVVATFDQSHVLILQGAHAVTDEASGTPAVIHSYIPYPQGAGLTPFLHRPIPVPGGFRAVMTSYPGSPTLANTRYRDFDFEQATDRHPSEGQFSLPEVAVGITGIDAVTDFKTSLVISHRWSNNESGEGIGAVHQGGWIFWRVIGHVAVY
jgi:hypothetical protein